MKKIAQRNIRCKVKKRIFSAVDQRIAGIESVVAFENLVFKTTGQCIGELEAGLDRQIAAGTFSVDEELDKFNGILAKNCHVPQRRA